MIKKNSKYCFWLNGIKKGEYFKRSWKLIAYKFGSVAFSWTLRHQRIMFVNNFERIWSHVLVLDVDWAGWNETVKLKTGCNFEIIIHLFFLIDEFTLNWMKEKRWGRIFNKVQMGCLNIFKRRQIRLMLKTLKWRRKKRAYI